MVCLRNISVDTLHKGDTDDDDDDDYDNNNNNNVLVGGNLKERENLEDVGANGRTVLKQAFRNWMGGSELD